MLALLQKEISSFFSSLTGYIVIIVFITLNGLFIWVFPGELNILDGGYATLDTLFIISPWLFLFLIPAITMRAFAEEKKSGTLDLLVTRPINDLQIVLAKYLASVVLAILALLPSLIYFISVSRLGSPTGNIDTGGTWGSYIGLFFLAAIYASVGIFASTLTDNIIVSFLISVLICFLLYTGFDYLANLSSSGSTGSLIAGLGIDSHYQSISRGVIDSRDIIYFLSVISIFIVLAKIKLSSRLW